MNSEGFFGRTPDLAGEARPTSDAQGGRGKERPSPVYANRLRAGDCIGVVAPSGSLHGLGDTLLQAATRTLSELGYRVRLIADRGACDAMGSTSVQARVDDLHAAFLDDSVAAILAAEGGFNANQLLPYIDYACIADHPKIFCGYSDITVLLCAIYARTGLVTYHGPQFSTFGYGGNLAYTARAFTGCLTQGSPYDLPFSSVYTDTWSMREDALVYTSNPGPGALVEGEAVGRIVGGNLCSLNLLQGTAYMPDLEDAVLWLEDDNIMGKWFPYEFDRNLQSLSQLPGFDKVRALVLGRFESSARMDEDTLRRILATKPHLGEIPVVYNVDFGHTAPVCTFPIGGRAQVIAREGDVRIRLLEH